MHWRMLGGSGQRVPALGLGCWGLSGAYGSATRDEAADVLHAAIDRGATLLDTADSYGDGHNERLLGDVLGGRRSEVLLATKTGLVTDPATGAVQVDCRPERIQQACRASLQRLQTEVIDIYYLHRRDPTVPLADSVGAVADLIQKGYVRFLGLCEVAVPTIRQAQAACPITAVESELSLWTREAQREVVPFCRQQGISFVAFSPLGRGFLTAAIRHTDQLAGDDWRRTNPRFHRDNLARNQLLLAPLERLAEKYRTTPATIALAWLLSQDPRIVAIPGTRRRSHLEQNVRAVELTLDPADLRQLDQAFPPGVAAGHRYASDHHRWVE